VTIFRGAGSGERRRRLYGFSWTTDITIARIFAEKHSHLNLNLRGVILRTRAPADAILLIRPPEDYFDEGEVVVDPYHLGKVELTEQLT
jgi:hypothetical protein